MDELEQQLFALELVLGLRLALDGPEVRAALIAAIEAGMAEAGPVERAIRQRALTVVRGDEAAAAPQPIQLRGS